MLITRNQSEYLSQFKYKNKKSKWFFFLKYSIKNKLIKYNISKWTPNIKLLEIDITSHCNLNCENCDRSCSNAPDKNNLTIKQINKFIQETKYLNWNWKKIKIMGGEPTLHPKLLYIINLFNKNNFSIELWTNGTNNNILKKIPKCVQIINSNKPNNIKFDKYNIAPIDIKLSNTYNKGCFITEISGISLTKYGYYPCGAGAAIDRIFGFNIGIKNLKDVNLISLRNQLKYLCKYCGHYNSGFINNFEFTSKKEISKSWIKAYKKYFIKKPKLTKY